MDDGKTIISAACPLFVCKACRTKTGWAHQRWCSAGGETPGCGECLYRGVGQQKCKHPILKRKERASG